MYICIYVYMYICIYVYMYICLYVYMYICMYVCMYVCMYMYVYIYMHYVDGAPLRGRFMHGDLASGAVLRIPRRWHSCGGRTARDTFCRGERGGLFSGGEEGGRKEQEHIGACYMKEEGGRREEGREEGDGRRFGGWG
jgi:hypothetical protein